MIDGPDRPIPSNVRSFFEVHHFFCSCEPVVIVAFIRGSNWEERRFVHTMWIIRCGSCSRGGKETDDSEYSFFFSSVHFKHFLSFFLYFTCYYSQPFYISPFENMITIEHDSKLFFAIFNNSIRIIIVTLYRLQLEFNGIIRNTIDITVKRKIIVDTFFFHPSFVKLFPFLDSLVTPFEASVEDPRCWSLGWPHSSSLALLLASLDRGVF